MKLFLTGATGFLGQSLAAALLRRGWSVYALVRTPDSPRARALATMGAELVSGDLLDRNTMRTAMAGAELVIHNAAWYEVGVSRKVQERMRAVNVAGTENVLGLALELRIPRNVYVSSTVYYGDSGAEARDETFVRQAPYRFFYERTKAEAHEIALQYRRRGLPLILACPANVFGPNDHSIFGYFLRLYLNGLMVPCAISPEQWISPAHVDDVSEGIALAAAHGRIGQTYILAGESMTVRQMFGIWNGYPGRLKVRFYLPTWLAKILAVPLEPLQRLLNLPAFISSETVSAGSISHNFSSAKAQEELGWTYRPATEMWSGIVEEELRLLAARQKRDLVSRLKPVDDDV